MLEEGVFLSDLLFLRNRFQFSFKMKEKFWVVFDLYCGKMLQY